MWMLSLIPDSVLIWFINIILLAGLVGTLSSYFIRFIPPLIPYAGLVKTLGIVLLVAGVWFRGGYDVEMEWREKVREAEAKVKVAEEKSKETNTVIQKVYIDRVKTVKDTQYVIQERIKEVEKIIDKECKVVPEAIDIHNAAAKNRKPGDNK
jgi:hypothetical protein